MKNSTVLLSLTIVLSAIFLPSVAMAKCTVVTYKGDTHTYTEKCEHRKATKEEEAQAEVFRDEKK